MSLVRMGAFRLGVLAPPAIFTSLPVKRAAVGLEPTVVAKPRPADSFAAAPAPAKPRSVEPHVPMDPKVREAAASITGVAAKLRLEAGRLLAAKPGLSAGELNAQLGAFVRRLPANERASLGRAMDTERSAASRDQFWSLMRNPDFARKYFEVNAAFLRSRSGR